MDSDVVQAARAYLGVRFHHQGRGPNGLDCAGLVVRAYADCGVQLADARGYSRTPHAGMLAEQLKQSFRQVQEPQPGDVLLMAFAGEPQHLAIYAGRTVIHSYERAGGVVEHRYALVWQARVRGVYRYV